MNNQKQLDIVVKSLERVDESISKDILQMSINMSEIAIIQTFNQVALDLFTFMKNVIDRLGKEHIYKIAGYRALFDNAIKFNSKLPIDKFTLIVLEFAPEIYSQDEDCFLKMSIPDKNVKVGNSFGFIRSEEFKDLWKVLDKNNQESISEKVISLTTYAHAYLYKTIMNNRSK